MKNQLTLSDTAKSAVQTYIKLSEKFRNSYFWKPPTNASSRRNYEQSNSFAFEDENLLLKFNVSCSCKNIYVSKTVMIQGKSSNIKGLKNLI